jgi:hypothetical protein
MELEVTVKNCDRHLANDIRISKLFRSIPNYERYKTKTEMWNAIKSYYEGANDQNINDGVERYNLNYKVRPNW